MRSFAVLRALIETGEEPKLGLDCNFEAWLAGKASESQRYSFSDAHCRQQSEAAIAALDEKLANSAIRGIPTMLKGSCHEAAAPPCGATAKRAAKPQTRPRSTPDGSQPDRPAVPIGIV